MHTDNKIERTRHQWRRCRICEGWTTSRCSRSESLSDSGGTAVATSVAMTQLAHADLTHKIIGAFFNVHNELGHGFSEKIYRRALAIVLREMGLEATEERRINVFFHGILIGTVWVDIV